MKNLFFVFMLTLPLMVEANWWEETITVDQAKGMPDEKVAKIDPHVLSNMTAEALAALGPRLKLIPPQRMLGLRDSQLEKGVLSLLSPEQVSAMNGNPITRNGETLKNVGNFGGSRFSKAQIAQMSPEAKAVAGNGRDSSSGVIESPGVSPALNEVSAIPEIKAVPVSIIPTLVPTIGNASPEKPNLSEEGRAAILAASIDSEDILYDNCSWVEDLPRKIAYGPNNCPEQGGKRKVQVCVGYVECTTAGTATQLPLKFVRMATCKPELCDPLSAEACAFDPDHSSKALTTLESGQVSEELRSLIVPSQPNEGGENE